MIRNICLFLSAITAWALLLGCWHIANHNSRMEEAKEVHVAGKRIRHSVYDILRQGSEVAFLETETNF